MRRPTARVLTARISVQGRHVPCPQNWTHKSVAYLGFVQRRRARALGISRSGSRVLGLTSTKSRRSWSLFVNWYVNFDVKAKMYVTWCYLLCITIQWLKGVTVTIKKLVRYGASFSVESAHFPSLRCMSLVCNASLQRLACDTSWKAVICLEFRAFTSIILLSASPLSQT